LNLTGRKPTIPYDQLEPRLRELRVVHGLSMKELSQRLGYSVDHVKKLCHRFKIKVRGLNPNKVIDQAPKLQRPLEPEGAGQQGNHPAASDSAPSNSPKAGTSTKGPCISGR
jgi:hypothetical protein